MKHVPQRSCVVRSSRRAEQRLNRPTFNYAIASMILFNVALGRIAFEAFSSFG